ncbi:hypothetical protein GCM10023231_28910 [Olivibacter ginsenosidimutans]|uniref:DUF3823 domain-containing protein n=1 Tax=Olivibacter ginsenosidimutans TaxID=1176537 RepID=A0ABP9BNY9_9SPHI
MKTNKCLIFAFGIFISLFGACKNDIDNYGAPDGGIHGTVYDEETHEPIPLPVQGNAGVLVNLIEQQTNATKSVDFRAKQDGTYENSTVFNGDYKVVINGPFVNGCEGYVTIDGQTQLDLHAVPFSRIDIHAHADENNRLEVDYEIHKTDENFNLTEVSVMWNFAPGVDINSSNYAAKNSLGAASQGTFTFDLTKDANFVNNLYKIQANGNRVYVRVAAKVNNQVNYSKTIELILP